MPLTAEQHDRIEALLRGPCLQCGEPIERECPSIIRCQTCFEQWYKARYGREYKRRDHAAV